MTEMSFIIPALNEEGYIGECLESVKKQEHHHEIIVVDGGSGDRTREIAREKGAKIASDPGKNASVARNIGAEKAESPIYCFIDSDTTLPNYWSKKVNQHFQEKEVVAVGGPLKPRNPTLKDRLMYYLTTEISPTVTAKFNFHQFQGPNMAFRATAFHEIGGFNEKLGIMEDNEIANRIRSQGKVVWDRGLYAYESPRRFHKRGYASETAGYLKAYVKIYLSSSEEEMGYEKASEMD